MGFLLVFAAPGAAQPVRVGGDIKAPTKITDVRPVYPWEALSAKIQGIVIVEAIIAADGNVRDAQVLRSVPGLDEAALEAVRQWRYTPTLLNGEPVEIVMSVTVIFRITNDAQALGPPCPSVPALAGMTEPDTRRRGVLASVIDGEGGGVRGLTAASFRGQFNGNPVRVLSATEDASPRHVAIVIDTSADMDPVWEQVIAAAERAVGSLAPDHRASVLSVGEALHHHVGPSRDPEELRRALSTVRAGGPSLLFRGLRVAIDELPWGPLGAAILVLTHAEDTRSTVTPREVQIAGAEKGVRVFVGLLRTELRSASRFEADRSRITEIAEGTGGLVFQVNSGRVVDELAVRLLMAAITQTYHLEVEFTEPIDRARGWVLEVVDADGRGLSDTHVAYPRLLVCR